MLLFLDENLSLLFGAVGWVLCLLDCTCDGVAEKQGEYYYIQFDCPIIHHFQSSKQLYK